MDELYASHLVLRGSFRIRYTLYQLQQPTMASANHRCRTTAAYVQTVCDVMSLKCLQILLLSTTTFAVILFHLTIYLV